MKNLNLFFLTLILNLIMLTASNTNAQKITGDGNVVKETRSIGSFSEITTEGVVNVYLSQGSTESVVVEADKNLIAYIITKSDGDKLVIKTRDELEVEKSTKMNVYVTLKNITKLENNNVGKLETVNQLNLNTLNIDNNSVGSTKLDLKCSDLKVDFNSVGNLTLTGEITKVSIDHNGVGNVNAEELSADIVKIDNNGVGNAEVNCNKELYMNLNGIGNISYKGNGVVKELNISGMGKVKKM